MSSKKILLYAAIILIIFISSVSIYLVYSMNSNILHSSEVGGTSSNKKMTILPTEISPQIVTVGLDDLSLKGYLKTPDNTGIPNENVKVILAKINTDGNQTIKNLVVGNSTTNHEGCFYFNKWNSDTINKTLGAIPQASGMNNTLTFKTSFEGTDEFLSSSNVTQVRYSTIIPPIIRPAINVFLSNSSGFISQDIDLKRGKSYDFGLYVNGGVGQKIVNLDIKGVPCGVTTILENQTVNLIVQTSTTHLKISVDEKTKSGQYYYFIMGNNWILKEGKLIIE